MPSLNSIPPTRKEGIKKTLASGKWCCNTEGKRRESQHGGERRPGAQQRPLWAQLESLWEACDFLLKSVLLSMYLKTIANKVCLNKRVSWRQCTRKK